METSCGVVACKVGLGKIPVEVDASVRACLPKPNILDQVTPAKNK